MMTEAENRVKIENDLRKAIEKILPEYLQTAAFITRKLTDTPLDNNQVVSRGYVTLNGVSGSRPTSSIIGQFYFDTTLGYPVWWNGSTFVDAQGNPA